jgi:hypothetical protein
MFAPPPTFDLHRYFVTSLLHYFAFSFEYTLDKTLILW